MLRYAVFICFEPVRHYLQPCGCSYLFLLTRNHFFPVQPTSPVSNRQQITTPPWQTNPPPLRCANCNKPETFTPLLRCSACRILHYCNRTCQKQHWVAVHKCYCPNPSGMPKGTGYDHKDWPVQAMPARIYPHNTHFKDQLGSKHSNKLLLDEDEPTTYKLLIESFRAWDESKRCGLGTMADPRVSFGDGSVKYNTGYLFTGLMTHIDQAEKMNPAVLPPWWNAQARLACVKIAMEMYRWDDLDVGVPVEVNEWRRYGGPTMRLSLRMLGMKVEGISPAEAVMMGYMGVKPIGDNLMLHSMGRP